jgi:hypothetical protein
MAFLVVVAATRIAACETQVTCEYWQSKVDPAVPLQGKRLDELPGDADAPEAIRCLLRLRGRTSHGRFSGVTRFDVSQIVPRATMEIAALYYVTYIYERKWPHADAVMIDGPGGGNTTETVRNAFDAMERWLETVEKIGIARARKRRLHPLRGTPLHWYGRQPEKTP